MDSKEIEQILKKIIISDQNLTEELTKIRKNINEREQAIKSIRNEMESKAKLAQHAHSEKLIERMTQKTNEQMNQIHEQTQTEIMRIETIYQDQVEALIDRAFSKLTIERWSAEGDDQRER